MNEKLYLKKLIKLNTGYDIEKYGDGMLKLDCTPFVGTPKKHRFDKNILILLTDPFAADRHFYEFSVDSIGTIEELGTITSEDGETAMKIRVWVKKNKLAFKTEPFIVN